MELRDAMAMWGEKNNVELTQLENRTAVCYIFNSYCHISSHFIYYFIY